MPYLLRSSSNPFLPRPVYLTPSIGPNVPMSSDARVSGITVTLLRLPMDLVKETPCRVLLLSIHPSFRRSLINCSPVRAGVSVPNKP